MNSRKVQFHAVAQHLNDGVTISSNQTRIENFFRNAVFNYVAVAHLLLRLLPAKGKRRLCIDRMEWNFGKYEGGGLKRDEIDFVVTKSISVKPAPVSI